MTSSGIKWPISVANQKFRLVLDHFSGKQKNQDVFWPIHPGSEDVKIGIFGKTIGIIGMVWFQ